MLVSAMNKWYACGTNCNLMAHSEKYASGLLLPFTFNAMVYPITDVVCVGDWLVGYSEAPTPEFLDIGGELTDDLLIENVNAFSRRPVSPAEVRRFLLRTGTFRRSDWVQTAKALRSDLPAEVKDDVRRWSPEGAGYVYLINAKDFTREWDLLGILMTLATKVASHRSLRRTQHEIKAANEKLGSMVGIPHAISTLPRSNLSRMIDVVLPGDPVEDKKSDKGYETYLAQRETRRPLPQKYRRELEDLLQRCFSRVYGQFNAEFSANLEGGPGLRTFIDTYLGIAYLGLLSNFRQGWKKCKRQDCRKLFRITDDKRKVFCSQYCGHLVSLRTKREADRKGK